MSGRPLGHFPACVVAYTLAYLIAGYLAHLLTLSPFILLAPTTGPRWPVLLLITLLAEIPCGLWLEQSLFEPDRALPDSSCCCCKCSSGLSAPQRTLELEFTSLGGSRFWVEIHAVAGLLP